MTETIAKLLATDVPPEHVTQRQGGGGIKLDYVTGRYVKQRLNEIFGWDGWSYEVIQVQLFPEECTAFAHVRLKVMETPAPGEMLVSSPGVTKDGLAYGHGRKGAEGFDFAIAEAVTDALKRAAVSLGQNLGLSLYPYAKGDKDDHRADDEPRSEVSKAPVPEDGQVAMFATMIGSATSMDELKEVWHEINEAHMVPFKVSMLESLKDTAKERLTK